MSDSIKHECGVALIRLLKPLSFYREKYGSWLYALNKMYLMMEKQHNRGQDGAGLASIKLDMQPGERFINRIRSVQNQPIQDIFTRIDENMTRTLTQFPAGLETAEQRKKHLPFTAELLLGHVRYGTFGANKIENVHPFLRQNNWMHRNLIVAGNFNMTNVAELFDNLAQLGQHPKDKTDTVTIMEKIGHFLDDEVAQLYQEIKDEGYNKIEASPIIAKRLDLVKILQKAAKNWDGGYTMAGLLGHGDAFVLRDPAGIRPAYYYNDDELVIVASERPAIQTVFNLPFENIKELPAGQALIIKKEGTVGSFPICEPLEKKSCSFERIYFSRGNDAEIYQERKKLGFLLFPEILDSIAGDLENTVFSYIPNTAEASFFGLVKAAQDYLNAQKEKQILKAGNNITREKLHKILSVRPRIEKIAIKDVKLRTFITEDRSRDNLVAHIYDITYGVIKRHDNLVIIDDSIVRGTTLKKSILGILARLKPKKIIIVSSAPQIRYPDCYGIDMANLSDLVAFRAAIELHRERDTVHIIDKTYQECITQLQNPSKGFHNAVRAIYTPFSDKEITDKIAAVLTPENIDIPVELIFQSVHNLHKACPNHLGDWYFTGEYPTQGGNKVVNQAFVNFYKGIRERPY